MKDFSKYSATELLKLLEQGQTTSLELTQFFIQKIKETNPAINALVFPLFEQAILAAKQSDEDRQQNRIKGRLHGLPITIKECLDLMDTPSTFGLVRRKNDLPLKNDPYIEKLINEGAIILGKTNVAQLLMYYESNNAVYGTTLNPINPLFSSGGSSGGEAAIIAVGGSPLGIGTDIGGSIRIPSAFCGICGIKPTQDRIPDYARFVEEELNLPIKSTTGVLARSADDLELALGVLNDTNPENPTLESYRDIDLAQLKIGYYMTDHLFEPTNVIKTGIQEAIDILKAKGANVIEFTPPDLKKVEEIFFKTLSADEAKLFSNNLQKEKAMPQAAGLVGLAKLNPTLRSIIKGLTSLLGQHSLSRVISYFGHSGETFMASMFEEKENYIQQFIQSMDTSSIGKLDAIISPVCALPGYLLNTADKLGVGGTYAILNNVTGFPAGVATLRNIQKDEIISRPVSFDLSQKTAAKVEAKAAGLPLAVQITARPFQEQIIIALIKALHKK